VDCLLSLYSPQNVLMGSQTFRSYVRWVYEDSATVFSLSAEAIGAKGIIYASGIVSNISN
jgi:hypothetical protein